MNLVSEKHDGILVIRVAQDRIDAACAIQFKDRMREAAEAAVERIILDMSQVAFIDSSGLGAIVAVLKAVGPYRKLELCGLTPTVQKVFRLTRMDTIFVIHDQMPIPLEKAS